MPPEVAVRPQRGAPPAPPAVGAPDVSIVIVSWNVRDVLRGCLASIARTTGDLAVETIVVDNASRDGTTAMIARDFPRVRVIANPDNRGFAAANNQGMAIARGRRILLLNPDTVVLGDVIQRSLRWLDAHPDVGVMGCQVWESDDAVQHTCFRDPSPLHVLLWVTGLAGAAPRSGLWNHAAYGEWGRADERDVDVVSGMFMLVRREALAQVGPMDEDYFVYAEEADWCRRFRRAGWRCCFAPVGRILHLDGGSKSTDQVSVRMFVQMQKNIALYHRKQRGRLAWLAVRALFMAAAPLRWLAWRIVRALRGDEAAARKVAQSAAAMRFHWLGREPVA